MTPYRSSALLASAALVVGAVAAPCAAFADDTTTPPATTTPATTTITADDLTAALKAAQQPTTDAEKAGWSMHGTDAVNGQDPIRMNVLYAVSRDQLSGGGVGTLIQAQHRGTWISVRGMNALMPGVHVKRSLKAIGKQNAQWILMPEKKLNLLGNDSLVGDLTPDATLTDLLDPSQTPVTDPVTETVAADGATTYQFSSTDSDEETVAFSVTIGADDTLAELDAVTATEKDQMTFAYGAQHVSLPPRRLTVTEAQLERGAALADLPRLVRLVADDVATVVKIKAHKHAIKVGLLRSVARSTTRGLDRTLGLKALSTRAIAHGVRITGVNRHTHTRVSYTVTASGKKAVVRKG